MAFIISYHRLTQETCIGHNGMPSFWWFTDQSSCLTLVVRRRGSGRLPVLGRSSLEFQFHNMKESSDCFRKSHGLVEQHHHPNQCSICILPNYADMTVWGRREKTTQYRFVSWHLCDSYRQNRIIPNPWKFLFYPTFLLQKLYRAARRAESGLAQLGHQIYIYKSTLLLCSKHVGEQK